MKVKKINLNKIKFLNNNNKGFPKTMTPFEISIKYENYSSLL